MRKAIFLLLILLSPVISFAKSYENIKFGLYYTNNTNKSDLHDTWEAQPGYGFKISTPVMAGELQVTYSFLDMDSKSTNIPSYSSSLFTLGWSYDLGLPYDFHLLAGPTYGNYKMSFNDPNITDKTKTESEICLGISTELNRKVYNNVFAEIALQYHEVFTYKKIYLTFVRGGIIYRFDAPNWWQKAWK